MRASLILATVMIFYSCTKPSLFIGKWKASSLPEKFQRLGSEKGYFTFTEDGFMEVQFLDFEENERLGFTFKYSHETDSLITLHQYSFLNSLPDGTKIHLNPDLSFDVKGITFFKTSSKETFKTRNAPNFKQARVNPKSSRILIKNIQIVDALTNSLSEPSHLFIENGRIQQITPNVISVPQNTRVIEGSGKYLSPALWDMHTHFMSMDSPELTMPLYIANGVTNIRSLGVKHSGLTLEQVTEWRAQIKNRNILGPRVIEQSSFHIHGPEKRFPQTPQFFNPSTAEEAKQLVRYIVNQKFDSIKIYNGLSKDVYFALLSEAKKHQLPVGGHRPYSVSVSDAINAGQTCFEHGHHFIRGSFENETLVADYYNAVYQNQPAEQPKSNGSFMLDHQNPEKFETLIAAMKKNKTWLCPTHITRKFDFSAPNPQFLNDDRIKYIFPRLLQDWGADIESYTRMDHDDIEHYKRYYKKVLEYTYKAFKAGVNIMAGTDANDSFSFPGSALIDELETFVEAGLTPAEALQTATVNPAKYAKQTRDYGTVQTGKIADLLILDKNPLTNIRNLENIHQLIYQSAIYSSTDLEQMRLTVENNVNLLK